MKSTGTQYWLDPNIAADNSSGFSGIPDGNRYDVALFSEVAEYGIWWSSTPNLVHSAFFCVLGYDRS